MNKRVSTLVTALLLATTLGWQQPLVNVSAATHNAKTTKVAKKATKKTAKTTKKAKAVKQSASAGKHIKLQGEHATNFRDLGGYVNKNGQKIKAHRLIRSNKLMDLTKSDEHKLTKTYHVKTDIDLRTDIEQQHEPDKKISGVHFIQNPIFKKFGAFPDFKQGGTGTKMMEKSYHDAITTAQGRKAFKTLFKALLNNPSNSAVLWHCSAGKDRAGMSTMLVLSALNVDKKTIYKDYLKSNQYLAAENTAKLAAATANAKKAGDTPAQIANVRANTQAQNGVYKAYLDVTYKTIHDKYGSVKNFLHKGLGLSNHQLAQLQKSYLTPAKK